MGITIVPASSLLNPITELTGDVTAKGPGVSEATISAHAVTLAKIQQIDANCLLGNNTGSSADTIELTVAQVKTLLGYVLASSDFANEGTITTVLHGNASGNPSFGAVVEADITLADNTTNNVSTSRHGFVPKAPNDATYFLNGADPPAWSVPAGGGGAVSFVSTTDFTAQSSVSITGLSPGVRYKFFIDFIQNTSEGRPYIQFNLDTGTNYHYEGIASADATTNPWGANSGATFIILMEQSMAVGYNYVGEFSVKTAISDSTKVFVNGDAYFERNDGGVPGRAMFGGMYDGASDLSSIQFKVSAGTATGSIALYTWDT